MPFVNQSIAILGWGDEGKDIAAWLKINSQNCRIKVWDKFTAADLTGFNLIFRSPGFYRYSPMLVQAEAAGSLITSATKLFFALCPAKIIGVTGTKGKGTTTTLIYKMLKAAGQRAFIAGNIGKPMLKLLPRLKPTDWVCLELSSFQLHDLTQSPHIAVVLDISRDHLDIHRNVQEYRAAKANLWRWQKTEDFTVTNSGLVSTRGKIIHFSAPGLNLNLNKIRLLGKHNLENLAAAAAAVKLVGVKAEAIEKIAYGFSGLEHRLEFVREVKGIKFYDDSASTTPETAMAAIKSFSEPLTVIMGGSEKGSDYRQLGRAIVRSPHLKNLILIGKTAPKIKAAAKGFPGKIITGLTTMKAIVKTAAKICRPGEVVVLSPGCASFDMFTHYKDRGEQFKLWVKKL